MAETEHLRKKLEKHCTVKSLLDYADAVMKLAKSIEYEGDKSCALCNGPLVFMGKLGHRDHFRCRNCGHESSYLPEEVKIYVQGNTNAGTEEEG